MRTGTAARIASSRSGATEDDICEISRSPLHTKIALIAFREKFWPAATLRVWQDIDRFRSATKLIIIEENPSVLVVRSGMGLRLLALVASPIGLAFGAQQQALIGAPVGRGETTVNDNTPSEDSSQMPFVSGTVGGFRTWT